MERAKGGVRFRLGARFENFWRGQRSFWVPPPPPNSLSQLSLKLTRSTRNTRVSYLSTLLAQASPLQQLSLPQTQLACLTSFTTLFPSSSSPLPRASLSTTSRDSYSALHSIDPLITHSGPVHSKSLNTSLSLALSLILITFEFLTFPTFNPPRTSSLCPHLHHLRLVHLYHKRVNQKTGKTSSTYLRRTRDLKLRMSQTLKETNSKITS